MQWGLRNLQRAFQSAQLEKTATHHISQLLKVPCVALVVWESHEPKAQISKSIIRDKNFEIHSDKPILVSSDAIINWALQTDGILPLNLEDLPDTTRQWFTASHGCQLLIAALRTAPEHEPNGVIVLADHSDRRWSEQQMNMLAILVNQLAWCRRHLLLTERLTGQKDQLSTLNWYKQKHIVEMQRQMSDALQRFTAFAFEQNFATNPRHQQVTRQLQRVLENLTHIQTEESWELISTYAKVPLVTLLNRLMGRVNTHVQTKQLWTKVHCESNLSLGGDMQKIEFVLLELLTRAW